VSETIFDAGLRRATVNQYIATYNADVASYRQTVLTAFQQVEDYLARAHPVAADQQQQQAVQSAKKYVDLETGRYETGSIRMSMWSRRRHAAQRSAVAGTLAYPADDGFGSVD
jgi:outer membrane protein TolC